MQQVDMQSMPDTEHMPLEELEANFYSIFGAIVRKYGDDKEDGQGPGVQEVESVSVSQVQ